MMENGRHDSGSRAARPSVVPLGMDAAAGHVVLRPELPATGAAMVAPARGALAVVRRHAAPHRRLGVAPLLGRHRVRADLVQVPGLVGRHAGAFIPVGAAIGGATGRAIGVAIGGAVGWTPREIDDLSLWEFRASIGGYAKANTSAKDQLSSEQVAALSASLDEPPIWH